MSKAQAVASILADKNNIKPEERRPIYNKLLKKVMADNNDAFGLWTVWAPDALDSMDKQYINTEGHDETGRFIIYWNKLGGLHLEGSVGYDDPVDGQYFQRAFETQKDVVMEPFEYPVSGQLIQMVSICTPIIIDGKSVGTVGFDMLTDDMKQIVAGITPYGTGFSFLLAQNGNYAAHPKEELFNKEIGTEGFYPNAEELKSAISSGDKIITQYEVDGKTRAVVLVPIQFGNYNETWAFGIDIPLQDIIAENNVFYKKLIITLVIAVLIVLVFLVIISNSISIPILKMRDIAINIVAGKLDNEITRNSKDEAGMLADSFRDMQNSISGVINVIAETTENTINKTVKYSVMS